MFLFCLRNEVIARPNLLASIVTTLSRSLANFAIFSFSVINLYNSLKSYSFHSIQFVFIFFLNSCLIHSIFSEILDSTFAIYCIAPVIPFLMSVVLIVGRVLYFFTLFCLLCIFFVSQSGCFFDRKLPFFLPALHRVSRSLLGTVNIFPVFFFIPVVTRIPSSSHTRVWNFHVR